MKGMHHLVLEIQGLENWDLWQILNFCFAILFGDY